MGRARIALRFLPYLGPWIAAAVPIPHFDSDVPRLDAAVIVFGWYVIVELVVYNFIEPFVYGSIVGVSTVGILVAALFWTWLWGPIGLVLAMPMTVPIGRRPIRSAASLPAILLGDQSTFRRRACTNDCWHSTTTSH